MRQNSDNFTFKSTHFQGVVHNPVYATLNTKLLEQKGYGQIIPHLPTTYF